MATTSENRVQVVQIERQGTPTQQILVYCLLYRLVLAQAGLCLQALPCQDPCQPGLRTLWRQCISVKTVEFLLLIRKSLHPTVLYDVSACLPAPASTCAAAPSRSTSQWGGGLLWGQADAGQPRTQGQQQHVPGRAESTGTHCHTCLAQTLSYLNHMLLTEGGL